jgi:hypothetical protein
VDHRVGIEIVDDGELRSTAVGRSAYRRPEQVQRMTHEVTHAIDVGPDRLPLCGYDGPFELLADTTFETWQPPRPGGRRCPACTRLASAAAEGDSSAL